MARKSLFLLLQTHLMLLIRLYYVIPFQESFCFLACYFKSIILKNLKFLSMQAIQRRFDKHIYITKKFIILYFRASMACFFWTASRRFQATQWLRRMDGAAMETLPTEPSEEEFSLALGNGLILCNVLNRVNPRSFPKLCSKLWFWIMYLHRGKWR